MPVLATGQLASAGLESSGMIPDEPGNLFYRPCILAEVLDHHRFSALFRRGMALPPGAGFTFSRQGYFS
jgi:hypothetical protein